MYEFALAQSAISFLKKVYRNLGVVLVVDNE